MPSREFDIVLFGATGFAGRQAVAYFTEHAPHGLRWAIAGRDRARLVALDAKVPILIADSGNQDAVDTVVAKTRVLLTTAGPFKLYGDPFVDACVRLGVHYVDISGETARIRSLIDRYHLIAKAARVRIVNFCAISSTPADLGVFLLNKQLDGRLLEAKGFFQLGGGSFSGGTIASISHAHDSGHAAREKDIFLLNPDCQRAPEAIERDPRGVRYTRAVRRSGALTGKDIVYQEYATFPSYFGALGFSAIIGLFGAAMCIRPVRNFLQKKLPPGTGPSEAAMDAGWFQLQILGKSQTGQKAIVTLKGKGDAGNRITVKCLCESAFPLAVNEAELPQVFGVLTPSVAFGDVLVERLRDAGIEISAQDL